MTDVQVSADPTEISVGGITQVVASVLPANATDKKITYKSSNPSIASVDSETGVVTGISGGTATITASSSNGKSKSIDITVTYVPVTKITVNPSAVVIGVTGTYELKANIRPENASAKLPIWSSSDETVATVDSNSGKVTGVAEGTATITASVVGSEVVGQCVVIVGKAVGVTMKLANPYAYEVNGKSIGETVLYGKDMDIVVHVNRDGQPAKNTNVTLKMVENNIEGANSNTNSSHYEIKGDGYNTTDQYGDIHFAVALKKDFADKNAINGGESETYTLTAMDVSTGNKAEIKVNTAVFDIGGITVSDNGGVKAGKNWKSENQSKSAKIKTKSLDAETENQVYLASQEVSLSGKEDHNVEFVVNPKIRFGLDEKATRNEWSREYTDNNPAKPGAGASDTYSIYNAADNTTTTTQIERVPAGMAYLTVDFSKIDISKYTKIHVGLTQKGQPVADKVTLTNENNTGSNSNIRCVQPQITKIILRLMMAQISNIAFQCSRIQVMLSSHVRRVARL